MKLCDTNETSSPSKSTQTSSGSPRSEAEDFCNTSYLILLAFYTQRRRSTNEPQFLAMYEWEEEWKFLQRIENNSNNNWLHPTS